MQDELIRTRTYSLEECKGVAFNLEGNDAFYPMGGLFASMLVAGVCWFFKAGLVVIILIAPLPAIISFVWLLVFVYKKPKGYQIDYFEQLLGGDAGETDKKQPENKFQHLLESINNENA